jgi:hypothetical protein
MKHLLTHLYLSVAFLIGSSFAATIYPPDYARVVMFFESKAPYYHEQFAIVTRLRAEGHEVKLVNAKLHPDQIARYKITKLPTYVGRYTTDDGRNIETGRIVGVATYEQLRQLALQAEQ